MGYLTPDTLNDTVFPTIVGKDLLFHIESIREKWERHYTGVPYKSMKVSEVNVNPDALTDIPATPAGTTAIDPLWGEPVDPDLAGVAWKQPHTNPSTLEADVDATDKFEEPVLIPMRVEKGDTDKQRKAYGFSRDFDMILTAPAVFFDDAEVTVKEGDVLTWDGKDFVITAWSTDGRWYNTNVPLYLVLACARRVRGA